MALILFDIDGTLLRPLGVGRSAFQGAIGTFTGRSVLLPDFPYDGLLDTDIAAKTLRMLGEPHGTEAVSSLLDLYLDDLEKSVPVPISEFRCLGIPALLDMALSRNHSIGLVTGNVKRGAAIKLSMAGLLPYFSTVPNNGALTGAFGDEAPDRTALVSAAVNNCRRHFCTNFALGETWVVGDSPRDVEAASMAGVHCVAVSTGLTSFKALSGLNPDLLLHNLTSFEQFFRAVEDGVPG